MRRPPKPRISKERLKWVWKERANGGRWEPYHRVTWTENGKRRERAIQLDWGNDPRKLDDLWWQCESGKHEAQEPPALNHTWGKAFELWKADPRIKNKAGKIKDYGRAIDILMEKNARKEMSKATKAGFRKKHDDNAHIPRQADKFLAFSSMLWNYARDKQDWPLGPNPVKGIDHYGKQREFEPWPQWMLDKISTAPFAVECACRLILGTGQRPNAAILLQHDHFQGDTMSLLDEKTKTRFPVYCPAPLRDYVSSLPRKGQYLLAKNLREPLGYDAIEKPFREWRAKLGPEAKKYSMHGLRKVAIITLAEAGWSDAEIQAWTNQSAEMVVFYRQHANRKNLTQKAWERSGHER